MKCRRRCPNCKERSIRLHNTPSGGIQFAIDGVVYEDVNDIPDELVRKLIKAATREWERPMRHSQQAFLAS